MHHSEERNMLQLRTTVSPETRDSTNNFSLSLFTLPFNLFLTINWTRRDSTSLMEILTINCYASQVHRHSSIHSLLEILGLSANFRCYTRQIQLLNERNVHQRIAAKKILESREKFQLKHSLLHISIFTRHQLVKCVWDSRHVVGAALGEFKTVRNSKGIAAKLDFKAFAYQLNTIFKHRLSWKFILFTFQSVSIYDVAKTVFLI